MNRDHTEERVILVGHSAGLVKDKEIFVCWVRPDRIRIEKPQDLIPVSHSDGKKAALEELATKENAGR